jgi:hypothetical protein
MSTLKRLDKTQWSFSTLGTYLFDAREPHTLTFGRELDCMYKPELMPAALGRSVVLKSGEDVGDGSVLNLGELKLRFTVLRSVVGTKVAGGWIRGSARE